MSPRRCLERPARQNPGVGEANGLGHRRRGPTLPRNDQSGHRHRRRHGVGLSRGAELRDVEFLQFHPTVLYIAGGSRSLISEAVRGEGAWLVDRSGRRFMTDYDPRGELAPATSSAWPLSARWKKRDMRTCIST